MSKVVLKVTYACGGSQYVKKLKPKSMLGFDIGARELAKELPQAKAEALIPDLVKKGKNCGLTLVFEIVPVGVTA